MDQIDHEIRNFITTEISRLSLINIDKDQTYKLINCEDLTYSLSISDLDIIKPEYENKISLSWSKDIRGNSLLFNCQNKDNEILFHIDESAVRKSIIDTFISNYKGDNNNNYGRSNIGKGKRILIYSSNVSRPFNYLFVRSGIIGNYIKNIHQMMGYEVIHHNYLGVWKRKCSFLAFGWKRYGGLNEINLEGLYKIFSRLKKEIRSDPTLEEEKDNFYYSQQENELCEQIYQFCQQYYQKVFQDLGIKFDEYHDKNDLSNMDQVFEKLIDKGLLESDQDIFYLNLKNHERVPIMINQIPTLLLRDLCEIEKQMNQGEFEKCYYVDTNENHFDRLFAILNIFYPNQNKFKYIKHGRIVMEDDLKPVNEIIDDISQEIHRVYEITSNQVKALSSSSFIFQDLKNTFSRSYKYDKEKLVSLKKNALYLQNAYYNLNNKIIVKLREKVELTENIQLDLLNKVNFIIIRIGQYPIKLKKSFKLMNPSILANYLIELANDIKYIKIHLDLNEDEESIKAGLFLYWLISQTMKLGFQVLGLQIYSDK